MPRPVSNVAGSCIFPCAILLDTHRTSSATSSTSLYSCRFCRGYNRYIIYFIFVINRCTGKSISRFGVSVKIRSVQARPCTPCARGPEVFELKHKASASRMNRSTAPARPARIRLVCQSPPSVIDATHNTHKNDDFDDGLCINKYGL